jgi:hypothetical protein
VWEEERLSYPNRKLTVTPAHWKLFRKDRIPDTLIHGYRTLETAEKAAKAVCFVYGEQEKSYQIRRYRLIPEDIITKEAP